MKRYHLGAVCNLLVSSRTISDWRRKKTRLRKRGTISKSKIRTPQYTTCLLWKGCPCKILFVWSHVSSCVPKYPLTAKNVLEETLSLQDPPSAFWTMELIILADPLFNPHRGAANLCSGFHFRRAEDNQLNWPKKQRQDMQRLRLEQKFTQFQWVQCWEAGQENPQRLPLFMGI